MFVIIGKWNYIRKIPAGIPYTPKQYRNNKIPKDIKKWEFIFNFMCQILYKTAMQYYLYRLQRKLVHFQCWKAQLLK